MSQRKDIHKVLIIGSGPIVIGQACEFDYSGTQACKALKSLGYEIVLVNSNPATIMTDPETADVTYIEPLNPERMEQIIAKERPDALLPNLGGQSGLNLCSELAKTGVLEKYNVQVIGVQVDAIERGEDRIEFKKAMDSLGIEMARSEVAYSVEEAMGIADRLGYPVVLRPAYTMGGAGGGLVYNVEELKTVCARDLPASDSFYLSKCIFGVDDGSYRDIIVELSELLEVKELLNVQVRRLSLGERMKMEILAALIHRPDILFLDEPTIGLDILSQKRSGNFSKYIMSGGRRRSSLRATIWRTSRRYVTGRSLSTRGGWCTTESWGRSTSFWESGSCFP